MKYLLLAGILALAGCAKTDSAGQKYKEAPTVCVLGHRYFEDRYGYTTGAVYNTDGSLIPCNKTYGTIIIPIVD